MTMPSAILGFNPGRFSGRTRVARGIEYVETPSGYWTRADGRGPLLMYEPSAKDTPPLVARVRFGRGR